MLRAFNEYNYAGGSVYSRQKDTRHKRHPRLVEAPIFDFQSVEFYTTTNLSLNHQSQVVTYQLRPLHQQVQKVSDLHLNPAEKFRMIPSNRAVLECNQCYGDIARGCVINVSVSVQMQY